MAFVYEGKTYTDKEELIQLLKDHVKDFQGTMILYDKTTGRSSSISFEEFINKVGYEEAAEVMLRQDTMVKEIVTNRSEMIDIARKYKSGEELTEEDKEKIITLLAADGTHINNITSELYHMLTAFINENKVLKASGFFGLICSYLPQVLASSSDVFKAIKNDSNTLLNVGKQIGEDIIKTWKATLGKEMPPEMMALGLMFALGDMLCIHSPALATAKIDVEDMISRLNLDREYINNAIRSDPDHTHEMDCDGNCAECDHHPEGFDATIPEIVDSFLKEHNIDTSVNSAAANLERQEPVTPAGSDNSKIVTPNIVDVRDRLKNKRRDV